MPNFFRHLLDAEKNKDDKSGENQMCLKVGMVVIVKKNNLSNKTKSFMNYSGPTIFGRLFYQLLQLIKFIQCL